MFEYSGRDDEPLVYKNWKMQHWAENSRAFTYSHQSGRLTVVRNGIYFIYAQVGGAYFSHISAYTGLAYTTRWPKKGTIFVRLNFIKY